MPRRPYSRDNRWVILKRIKLARKIRRILYGLPDEEGPEAPCWGDHSGGFYRREMTWSWQVREYVEDRSFRYSELLNEARRYVELHGPTNPTGLEQDLRLLRAWEDQVSQKRFIEKRRQFEHLKPENFYQWVSQAQQKKELLSGLCPSCGDPLPCEDCAIPEFEIDGKGGIRPKVMM